MPQAADIETSSRRYAQRFAGPVGDYFLRVQESICVDLLRRWAGCRVLDVGGGHAQIAVPLAAAGYDVTVVGSDPACNARLTAIAASRSLKIRFVTGNLLDLPFPDGSYNVVVSLRLISHVPAWRRLVRELTRVARHAVLIDYPSLINFNLAVPVFFRLKKMVERDTRPFLCFTKRQIAAVFRENGYAISATRPQFFIPMALHRAIGSLSFTQFSEKLSEVVAATRLLGSPVLALAEPAHSR